MTNWYQSCSSSAMAEVSTLDSWRDRWQNLSLESQDFHRKSLQNLNEIRISLRMPLSDFSPDVAIEYVRLPREIPKEGDVSYVDEELKCFAKEIMNFDQVWSQLSLDEKISWSRVSLGLSPSFDYSIQTTGKRELEPNSTSAPMNNSGVNQSPSKDATNLNQSQEMGVNQSRNAIGVNQIGIPPPSVLGTGPAEKAREFARTGPIPSPISTASAIIKNPGMCLLPSTETLQEENGALDYTDSEQEASDEGNSVEKIEDRLEIENTHQVFDGMTTKDLLKNSDMEVAFCASNTYKGVVNSSIPDQENGEQNSHGFTNFIRGIEFFSKLEYSSLTDEFCFPENRSSAAVHNASGELIGIPFNPIDLSDIRLGELHENSFEILAIPTAQELFEKMHVRGFKEFDPGGVIVQGTLSAAVENWIRNLVGYFAVRTDVWQQRDLVQKFVKFWKELCMVRCVRFMGNRIYDPGGDVVNMLASLQCFPMQKGENDVYLLKEVVSDGTKLQELLKNKVCKFLVHISHYFQIEYSCHSPKISSFRVLVFYPGGPDLSTDVFLLMITSPQWNFDPDVQQIVDFMDDVVKLHQHNCHHYVLRLNGFANNHFLVDKQIMLVVEVCFVCCRSESHFLLNCKSPRASAHDCYVTVLLAELICW